MNLWYLSCDDLDRFVAVSINRVFFNYMKSNIFLLTIKWQSVERLNSFPRKFRRFSSTKSDENLQSILLHEVSANYMFRNRFPIEVKNELIRIIALMDVKALKILYEVFSTYRMYHITVICPVWKPHWLTQRWLLEY